MSILTAVTRMWLTRSTKPFLFRNEYDSRLPFDDCDKLGLYVHIPGGCFYSLSCREIHFVLVICFIQQYIICAIACKPCLLEGAITI